MTGIFHFRFFCEKSQKFFLIWKFFVNHKCCGGLVVTTGDFGSEGRRFESWCRQANFLLYIGDLNSSVKWREYFGSHLFAAKIPGTMAGIKN